jgi:prepilin-type N-terminal cleavage/methylation domain-containing protein
MRPRRGFTLIELLVVMGIISILLAIVLPAFAKARSRGRLTACATNLRQIGLGFRSYLQDNNEVFPFASFMPSISPSPLPLDAQPIYISEVLSRHVNESPGVVSKIFMCSQDVPGTGRDPDLAGSASSAKSYFDTEKSSYGFRTGETLPSDIGGRGRPGLCGRSMKSFVEYIKQRRDRQLNENQIWIMSDYWNFHAPAGATGSRRYLYLDGRVQDYEF